MDTQNMMQSMQNQNQMIINSNMQSIDSMQPPAHYPQMGGFPMNPNSFMNPYMLPPAYPYQQSLALQYQL